MGFYIGLLFRTFAILAKPVQHHCVFAEFVTVAERNDGLCPFNIRINKFHDFSALQADQMVMVVSFAKFISRTIRVKMMSDNKAGTLELGKDAINGCETDVHPFGDQLFENFFCGDMATFTVVLIRPLLKQLEDLQSGSRRFQPGVLQFRGMVSRRIVHVSPPFKSSFTRYHTRLV